MVDSYFNGIIEGLFINQVISSFKILRKEVFEEDGYIRIKCKLLNGDILEFSEYIVIHKNKVTIKTYSYHWQKADRTLIKRWDNVPHYKEVDTFPHHLHLTESKVVSSTKVTLKKILDEIEKTIIVHDE
jgi:hypothetical protein